MNTRPSAGIIPATLVLLSAACAAAPASQAATTAVTYNVTEHNHLVTVKDGAGKTLLTRRITTPTLRAIIVKSARASPTALPALSLTLEDQSGLRLWSIQVPVAAGMHSGSFSANSKSDGDGTAFRFTLSAEKPSGPDTSGAATLVCVIGADGRLVSMKAAADGKQYDILTGPAGTSFTGPDGVNMSLKPDPMGGTINVNGAETKFETVKKDGKEYISFPSNGHKVFMESTCTLSITDGDLTINAPAAAAKK